MQTKEFWDDERSGSRAERSLWLRLVAAALAAFAGLLAVAAMLLLAAKLQYPFIGAGSSTIGVVKALVLVALGCLRIPVTVGGVEVSALPLGGLLITGGLLVSSARVAIQGRLESRSFTSHLGAGSLCAIPLAALCWIAALVFRFEGGANPVSADPSIALIAGAFWGGLFGALGGAAAYAPLSALIVGIAQRIKSESSAVYYGVVAGVGVAAAALAAGAAALLLWLIVVLARDPGVPITLGTAAAAAIALVLFSPNMAVTVFSLSLGAPVEIGAKLTVKARALGSMAQFSLTDWNGRGTPRGLLLLLCVPLLLSLAAGYLLHGKQASGASRVSVLAAGVISAGLLALVAMTAESRLGAGLVRPAGFARVAPDAMAVFALTLAWVTLGGLAGWEAGRLFRRRRSGKDASAA